MSSEVRQAGPGPLSGVGDPVVSKELRKLWDVISAKTGMTGLEGGRFVTVDELNAAKRELLGKMPDTRQRAFRQDVGGGGTGLGIGGGVDLLPLNNTWTGTNTWTGGETKGINRYRFLGLTSGPITSFTTPGSILVEAVNYQALVDIQKSSEQSIFTGIPGGNAALYVQHRGGGNAPQDVGVYAIRAHAEAITVSFAGVGNSVAAGYFVTQNATTSGIGWGLKVEVLHKAVAGAQGGTSYGVEATMFRKNLDGKTIAIHAKAGQGGTDGTYNQVNDWGMLVSPSQGGAGKFIVAYGAGSDFIGQLVCDYGLDLAYATTDIAAIRIKPMKKITLNGTNNNVGFFFNDSGRIQYFSDIGDTVAIGNDGSIQMKPGKKLNFGDGGVEVALSFNPGGWLDFTVGGASMFQFGTGGMLVANNPLTTAGAGPQFGYWVVNLGGFLRKIPFFGF